MVKLSVILPNYNHAAFLQQRIDSILFQTYSDFQLIILDDASTDNSREIIESYRVNPKITHIIYNETNSGSPFRQLKKGLECAEGDWIWVAESDDMADKYFLDKMMKVVKLDPEIALAYCDAYIKDEMTADPPLKTFSDIKNRKFHTVKWKHSYLYPGERELNESLKWECTINNVSSVVFSKKHLAETIGQVQQYRYHGDWLLYMLLTQKRNIAYSPEPLNIYRDHEKNHSKAANYLIDSKKECFSILSTILRQMKITEKKELIRHFITNYIGFGLAKEKAFAKNGLFWEYWKMNKSLACKVLLRLISNKLKGNSK